MVQETIEEPANTSDVSQPMPKCAAIVVAAGRGSRFGGPLPKQYQDLNGAPLIRYTLAALDDHPRVSRILPVLHGDDLDLFSAASEGLDFMEPVIGGASRQDSVFNGLEALADDPPDIVLIHDGARPRVSLVLIDRVLDALADGHSGVIPALPMADTLKRVNEDGAILQTLERDGVVRAQTPQGFNYALLLEAHRACRGTDLTDDAAVMEHGGHTVSIVEGDADNLKVTTNDDMRSVAASLFETRTGMGFDVHRFEPGNGVWLGGIQIPFSQSLRGHSDADVALHAATDAILGAASDGDIGQHFPPNNPEYKDAPSDVFLRFAMDRIRSRLGKLLHLDLTIICEQPKIAPHKDSMRERIAEIADVDVSRVSIKATTTEGLGFTGRGEGIACQAVASISVPARD